MILVNNMTSLNSTTDVSRQRNYNPDLKTYSKLDSLNSETLYFQEQELSRVTEG